MAKDIIQPAVDVRKEIHEVIQRAAHVEDRFKTFEAGFNHLKENMLSQHKQLRQLIGDLDKDISKIQGELATIEDRVLTLRNEVLLRATKEDLAVLQKYVDMWNPFQFVTTDQIEGIVLDVLRQHMPKKKQS